MHTSSKRHLHTVRREERLWINQTHMVGARLMEYTVQNREMPAKASKLLADLAWRPRVGEVHRSIPEILMMRMWNLRKIKQELKRHAIEEADEARGLQFFRRHKNYHREKE